LVFPTPQSLGFTAEIPEIAENAFKIIPKFWQVKGFRKLNHEGCEEHEE
jgi:hypothetical protein